MTKLDDTQWQQDMWDSNEDIRGYTRREIKNIKVTTAVVTTLVVSIIWIIIGLNV